MTGRAAKYDNLCRAAEVARVPATAFVDETMFAAIIDQYAGVDRRIEAVLTEIAMTSGAVLDRHMTRLDAILDDVRLAHEAEDVVANALAGILLDWRTRPLAVRSAAGGEDQASRSAAGIYQSILDVTGWPALGNALLSVWRSFFSWGAVMERLAAGLLADGRRMSAMVQPMVPARAAGVAFSVDPVTGSSALCEYAPGLADRLLSGAAVGRTLKSGEVPADPHDPLGAAGARAIFSGLERLRRHFDQEIDVEWVWDGREATIVQVRPISTLGNGEPRGSLEPVFDLVPLYEAEDADLGGFEPLPEFARYFRAKRRSLQLLARELGLPRLPALLLRYNRGGIELPAARERIAAIAARPEVVIDASDRVRQMIVPGSSLLDTLRALAPETRAVGVVTLRAFASGKVGFITQPREDGGVAIEYSAQGLLALNRGTAESHLAGLAPDGSGRPDWLDAADARLIVRAAAAACERFGAIQIEWVQDAEGLLMLDYSSIATTVDLHPSVIGTGFAHAPVVRLDDSATLTDMSEGPSISITSVPEPRDLGAYVQEQLRRIQSLPAPPIVVCRKPYALLAALIPHVAGFVFHSAPVLSHLSILIRENRKPALASPDLFAGLADGDWFMLDVPRPAAAQ